MKIELNDKEVEFIKTALNDLFHLSITKLGETNMGDIERKNWTDTKIECIQLIKKLNN